MRSAKEKNLVWNSLKVQNIVLIVLSVLVLASCGSSGNFSAGRVKLIENKLDQAYDRWQGTRYQLGGDNSRGIDCSALMMIIMKDQFGVKIPRTTELQIKAGKKVGAKYLMPGDFVFFRTGPNQLHVGILIRPGKFMHASTSQGVTISELNNPYWNKRIIGFRRFL
jgi:cell wall-associated NlpC family hydrolase